jgi:WD40 repeat protein
MIKNNESSQDKILCLSFNQDSSCFAIGTETGFKIYSSYPINHCFERNLNGGIGIIEMLYRSNILGLVGGGTYPKFNKNKLIIWDDIQRKEIAEFKFTSNVINIKLKKDRIFSICENKIFIFDYKTYKNIEIIQTADNPKGLIAISYEQNINIIAYPISNTNIKETKGKLKIHDKEKNLDLEITAHENILSYITMNKEGTILASASEKGTRISIVNCINGVLLQEFKRGSEKAEINYITFDNLGILVAVTSDRGTIHIWSMGSSIKKMKETDEIKGDDSIMSGDNNVSHDNNNNNNNNNNNLIVNQDDLPENKSSIFKSIFGVKGEWSFAQVRLEEQKCICSFDKDNNIIVISSEGKYYHAKLNTKKGGECVIDYTSSLMENENKNDN